MPEVEIKIECDDCVSEADVALGNTCLEKRIEQEREEAFAEGKQAGLEKAEEIAKETLGQG